MEIYLKYYLTQFAQAEKIKNNGTRAVAVRTRGRLGDLLEEFSGIVLSLKNSDVEEELLLEAFLEGLKGKDKKEYEITDLSDIVVFFENQNGGYEIDI